MENSFDAVGVHEPATAPATTPVPAPDVSPNISSRDFEGMGHVHHPPAGGVENTRVTEEIQMRMSVRKHHREDMSEEKMIADRCSLKAPRVVFRGQEPGTTGPGHTKSVLCIDMVQWGDHGNVVISGGEGKLGNVWSLATGQHLSALDGHIQRVSAITHFICPDDGPIAITASWDETIRFWQIASCFDKDISNIPPSDSMRNIPSRHLHRHNGHVNRIYSLAITKSVRNRVLVSGSSDNSIKVWSLPQGDFLYELRDKENVTWFLSLETYRVLNHDFIASGCRDNSIKLWRVVEPVIVPDLDYARSVPVKVISNLVSRVHSLCVVQLKTRSFSSVKRSSFVSTSPKGGNSASIGVETVIVALCKDIVIRLFSAQSGALLRVLEGGHTSPILSVYALNCDQNTDAHLVTSSAKGNICVWRFSTGELMRFFNGHTKDCTCVSIHLMERSKDLLIVSGGRDRSVRTWLYTEEQSMFNKVTSARINCIATCNSGEQALIFTGADDGSLQAELVSDVHGSGQDYRWRVDRAHPARIRSLAVYTPIPEVVADSGPEDAENPGIDITDSILVSGGRGMKIRLTLALDGSLMCDYLEGHTGVVTALSVFNGLVHYVRDQIPIKIMPFIVSGSEDNTVRLWDLERGHEMQVWEGHELDVLAVAVYVPPPVVKKKKRRHRGGGSGTSTARSGVHRLIKSDSGSEVPGMSALHGSNSAGSIASRMHDSLKDGADVVSTLIPYNPIIVSASMDCTVCVWSYKARIVFDEEKEDEESDEEEEIRGADHLLATLSNEVEDTHLNCVAVVDVEMGPIIIAGGGNGNILLWMLEPPYTIVDSLKGHLDEISSLHSFYAEGHGQILATGSCDRTVRVWSLNSMTSLRVLEGHTMDITGVNIFQPGSGDPAIGSVSTDCSIRVMFDFLGGMPKTDFVENQFELDMNEAADSALSGGVCGSVKWPRISDLASRQNGKDSFFSTFYKLFSLAVEHGRSDFLLHFLPGTRLGLLKTNNLYEISLPGEDYKKGSLLAHAMHVKDRVAVHCIVGCWLTFFTTDPIGGEMDLVYDSHSRFRLDELLVLADNFPREFERFICGLKVIPVIPSLLPSDGFKCLFQGHNHKITMEEYMCVESVDKVLEVERVVGNEYGLGGLWHYWSGRDSSVVAPEPLNAKGGQGPRINTFSFLPVPNMVHLHLLKAYIRVCKKLDSVLIFDSDAGQLGLAYIWRDIGLWIHSREMMIHFAYVLVASVSLYGFSVLVRSGYSFGAAVLLISMSLFDFYQGYKEIDEFWHNPATYFADGWNVLDLTYVVAAAIGNAMRLIYMEDGIISRVSLSIACICMWLHMFYFLRAFESTGPLVSMILRIWVDMQPFLAVLCVTLIGFSQAFWVLANSGDERDTLFAAERNASEGEGYYAFSTIGNSLIYSYAFMLVRLIMLMNIMPYCYIYLLCF